MSDPQLRKMIRADILAVHKQNRPIDRRAISAKYEARRPELANYIKMIVEDYSTSLEGKTGEAASRSATVQPSKKSTATSNGSPLRSHNTGARKFLPRRQTATRAKSSITSSFSPTESSPVESDSEDDSDTSDECWNGHGAAFLSEDDKTENADNAILQDFKEDLAGSHDAKHVLNTSSVVPSLEEQNEFLTSSAEDVEMTGVSVPANLEHAALFSPGLEARGCPMPSQFSLLGKLQAASQSIPTSPDPRVMLNTNVPFSAFICGVQGSGKSHTTSCIIENCSTAIPALGTMKRSVSTLVLHFNEYSSNVNSQPSEAAFLASVLPQYSSKQKPLLLRVLVSPTNLSNLTKMYSQIPNVQVRPFQLQPRHLNISMMLSLMSISQGDGTPLYMAQVMKVLRTMAMESGGYFDYSDFRKRLDDLNLSSKQTPFLAQRLDLLDSYLDLAGQAPKDYFVDGGVTILDLSCPFVDQSTACILFRTAIDLFLYAHPSRGKMIVADEAHKYMTDTSAAKELTETFLTIIRQQRHLGVRTVISTQEPTISPRLIDLCSITIIHRFTSPDWYHTIRKHLPIEKGNSSDDEGMRDGLYRITSLRTGEALVFAPSAHLLDGEDVVLDTRHRTFNMMVRKRITWDGGRTIFCVR